MAQSRQAIQSRIRSVESTRKITRVMQLIASTELTKQRRRMEENREYANGLEDLLAFAYNVNSKATFYEDEYVTLGRNLDLKRFLDYHLKILELI